MMSSGLITLATDEGQKLLKEVQVQGRYYQPLVLHIFKKQSGAGSCGIQSGSLLLNSAYLGKKSGESGFSLDNIDTTSLPYNEQKMYDFEATTNVKTDHRINDLQEGLTMDEVKQILEGFGQKVSMFFASDVTVDQFRSAAKEALEHADSRQGIIVNYHMATLGQDSQFGHFSPLVAYHEGRDMFLLMDTWPSTYESWARTEDFHRAMNTIDPDTNKTRGFLVCSD